MDAFVANANLPCSLLDYTMVDFLDRNLIASCYSLAMLASYCHAPREEASLGNLFFLHNLV